MRFRNLLVALLFFCIVFIPVQDWSQTACTLNFDQYNGPSDTSFTGATIKQGLLTVSGGAIAKYAASAFYDTSSIYLTIGGSLPPEMNHYYNVGEAIREFRAPTARGL